MSLVLCNCYLLNYIVYSFCSSLLVNTIQTKIPLITTSAYYITLSTFYTYLVHVVQQLIVPLEEI